MPSNHRRLFTIRGPDDDARIVTTGVPGCNPLHALLVFHTEALGVKNVKLRDGKFWFRDPADQRECCGTWTIVREASNGDAETVVVVIPPPE